MLQKKYDKKKKRNKKNDWKPSTKACHAQIYVVSVMNE